MEGVTGWQYLCKSRNHKNKPGVIQAAFDVKGSCFGAQQRRPFVFPGTVVAGLLLLAVVIVSLGLVVSSDIRSFPLHESDSTMSSTLFGGRGLGSTVVCPLASWS